MIRRIRLLMVFSFLGLTHSVFAQIGAVTPVKVKMSQGVNDGFKVLIPEVDQREAERAWEKYMKAYDGKTSKVAKTVDLLTTGVLIPSIEDTTIEVYGNFNQTPEGVFMNVFFVTKGSYLNNASTKASAINKLLKDFARTTAYDAVKTRLEEQSKQLEKLEKEQKSLVKDKEAYEKEIARAKETIAKREKDLQTNAKEQTKKQSEILDKKKAVNEVKTELGKYQK